MEPELKPNPTKVATKWALIFILTAIVLTYVFKFLNLPDNSPVRFITYAALLGYLILAQKEYKEQLGGYMTFGQGFSPGFRYGLFAGLLFGIFMFLYLAFLDHDALTRIINTQNEAMTAKGASSEQIDKSNEVMTKFGPVLIAFGVAVWFAVLGIIVSLIGAAIFKKERSPFETEEYTEPTE